MKRHNLETNEQTPNSEHYLRGKNLPEWLPTLKDDEVSYNLQKKTYRSGERGTREMYLYEYW
jgi:hypothetical protein